MDRITNPKYSNVYKTTGNKDKTTNPKDSNIYKTTVNNDNSTPLGSDVPGSCFCYKHSIPTELANVPVENICSKQAIRSEFNFGNPKFYYTDKITNPKNSNVCRTMGNKDKITNPKDSNICRTMGNKDKITNPKDSNVYKTMGNKDKITNPEDSYVYKTMGYNDNTTPAGSYILGLNLCYKHSIPTELANVPVENLCSKLAIHSEFNFGNQKFYFTNKTTNPKDSNVCKTTGNNDNSTPLGSNIPNSCFCYKHVIPSELVDVSVENLCSKQAIHSEFNFGNLKFYFTNKTTNPKDSYIYKTTGNNDNPTPLGSDVPESCFCYKHVIPSELVDVPDSCFCYKHVIHSEFNFGNPKFHYTDKITNPEDSNIYRTIGNNDNTTPTGSYVPESCFCYKHVIPLELADIPDSCFCYKHVIPSELVDNSIQNICSKHAIHSEFNFVNPKFSYINKTTNPKDSNVCRTMGNKDKITNPEDSYIYKTTANNDNSTPLGSDVPKSCFCYKHTIPSELVDVPVQNLCFKHAIHSEFNFGNPNFCYTNKITNPKYSNVCRTMGYNDNSTPAGSNIPDSCFCYKHGIPSELVDNSMQNLCFKQAIPSEFNFGNPKLYFTDKTTNPKDSYVYKTMGYNDNSTPAGSNIHESCFCYKHTIPTELANVSVENLCSKHTTRSEFNFGNLKFYFTNKTTNPKDSNVCRTMGNKDKITNPEDSNVYKTTGNIDNPTPAGSNIPDSCFCYKHGIPSELVDNSMQNLCFKQAIPSEFNFGNQKFYFTNKTTNPKDSNVCKTTGNNDNSTPSGLNIPGSCFCYKHVIPTELADISLQNLCFKHTIHSEFNFGNPKFYFTDKITNPKDSYIYKTTGNKDKTTNPEDSNVYKTTGKKDNTTPAGSNIHSELVDIFLPNLHSKHAIPMELLNNKLKSKC